ncbi:MAG: helix-turn-helix domain-containing protein [Candidatus Korobacteraceae bacterium]
MTLQALQDKLRTYIRARMERGEITGSALSRDAGFQQGHLSNFLNARRGLSVESMDRLLDSLGIGLLDLVDAADIQRHAIVPTPASGLESIALVPEQIAMLARFTADQIVETRSFSKAFLRRLKPNPSDDRADWLRFVLIRFDVRNAHGRLPPGIYAATLLLDRHYSSLQPYRREEPNLYAVRIGERCSIGYATVADEHLILRPQNPHTALEVVRIERGRRYDEYIVGRVCHVGIEV